MRILAVDDEPFILELMPLLATRAGFPDVTTASSGQLALEAIESAKRQFDCILLDINMPEMDGIEVCRRIRKIDGYRKVPIIMLTAMSEREYIDSAFKAGATDYSTKPFDISEFGARLRAAQELASARLDTNGSMTGFKLEADQMYSLDLIDDSSLVDIKDLVDIASLRNYIRQISRVGIAIAQVVAVKVDGPNTDLSQSTLLDLNCTLSMFADALNEVLLTKDALICYSGHGIFVAICHTADPLDPVNIESGIQRLLDQSRGQVFCNGYTLDVVASVGKPVCPDFRDLLDAPKSIERAIARAKYRSEIRRNEWPKPV